jgi:hypothetical protein
MLGGVVFGLIGLMVEAILFIIRSNKEFEEPVKKPVQKQTYSLTPDPRKED